MAGQAPRDQGSMVPTWMREPPKRRALASNFGLTLSWETSLALTLLVVATNMAVIGLAPAFAPLVLLASAGVIVFVVLRYRGEFSWMHKTAVLAACIGALCLMLVYVPPAMDHLQTSSRTEGLPVEVGFFASATILMGVLCLAFVSRERDSIASHWRAVVLTVLLCIDYYVWTSHDAVDFLTPLAYGAIWPMTLFTVTIPFTVFAYPRSYASVPMDAWR